MTKLLFSARWGECLTQFNEVHSRRLNGLCFFWISSAVALWTCSQTSNFLDDFCSIHFPREAVVSTAPFLLWASCLYRQSVRSTVRVEKDFRVIAGYSPSSLSIQMLLTSPEQTSLSICRDKQGKAESAPAFWRS